MADYRGVGLYVLPASLAKVAEGRKKACKLSQEKV